MKKRIAFIVLLILMLSMSVFSAYATTFSLPIETKTVKNNGTIPFSGRDSDFIPYNYNVELWYEGKVDYNPNTAKETIYAHHIYSKGYTFSGDPTVTLIQLIIYRSGVEKQRITSFSQCGTSHVWPGGQTIFFDKRSSTSATIDEGAGTITAYIHIYEYDVQFFPNMGNISVNL